MQKIKKIITSMLLVCTIAMLNAQIVFAQTNSNSLQNGWNVISTDNICYVENGTKLTGWQKIYTSQYLKENLIPDPNCRAGRYSISDAHWYYFDNNGNMKTGWLDDNGTWYYLDQEGVMVTEEYIDGFYLNEDGAYVYGKTMNKHPLTGTNHWGSYTDNDVNLAYALYESSDLDEDESARITERQFKALKESGHIGAVVNYTQVTPDGKQIGDLCFYYK